MKKLLLLLPLAVSCTSLFAQKSDTVRVYFETGKSALLPGVQEQITHYIYKGVLNPDRPVQIVGYADFVGGNMANDKLSQNRAKSVKKFLLESGFGQKDVTICIGKGEVSRENEQGNGFARDRRVDIVTNPTIEPPPAPVIEPKIVEQPVVAIPQKVEKPLSSSKVQDMTKLAKNTTIQLDNIYFYAGRHAMKPGSESVLDGLYKTLATNPAIKIQIEGHVCCVDGTISDALDFDTKEIGLSVNRAKAIYEYLVKRGISKTRLSYKGFGATRRIAQESNEEEADKNRRVEIRLL